MENYFIKLGYVYIKCHLDQLTEATFYLGVPEHFEGKAYNLFSQRKVFHNGAKCFEGGFGVEIGPSRIQENDLRNGRSVLRGITVSENA